MALFLSSIPSPYRVDFYNALRRLTDVEVWFEARRDPVSRFNWRGEEMMTFRHRYYSDSAGACQLHLGMVWQVLRRAWDKEPLVFQTYHTRTQTLCIALLRLLRRPYWFETDGGLINHGERWLSRSVKRWLIGGAVGWLSPSRVSDEYLTYYGADLARIHRYHFTSVGAEELAKTPVQVRKSGPLQLLAVGQFIPRKGFDVLLRAMVGVPCHLAIVGGEPTDEYLTLCREAGLESQVDFVGFQGQEALREWFRRSDLFVLPTREDIWGLVINEAMAQGLPVLTTQRCGAGLEMLPADCLLPVGDVEALHRQLLYLSDHRQTLQAQAVRNLQVAQHYTFEQMALDHECVRS